MNPTPSFWSHPNKNNWMIVKGLLLLSLPPPWNPFPTTVSRMKLVKHKMLPSHLDIGPNLHSSLWIPTSPSLLLSQLFPPAATISQLTGLLLSSNTSPFSLSDLFLCLQYCSPDFYWTGSLSLRSQLKQSPPRALPSLHPSKHPGWIFLSVPYHSLLFMCSFIICLLHIPLLECKRTGSGFLMSFSSL